MSRSMILVIALIFTPLLAVGCRAPECRQMQECCDAVADLEAVGESCGELAAGTKDPATCRVVLRNITYILEDQSEVEVPQECR